MKKLFTTLSVVALAATASQAQVVINEILYDVPGSGEDQEYVELYNTGANAVNLNKYTLADGGTPDITFNNVTIPAGGFIVVARDTAEFAASFGMAADYEWGGALSNGGEYILFKDSTGAVVDSVSYGTSAPWPLAGDAGSSIQLCDATKDNNKGANWGLSNSFIGLNASDSIYGTPGAANVCYTPPAKTYPLSTIAIARTTDANGQVTNKGKSYELRGVVYCTNFNPNGLDFKLIDYTNTGITVFKSGVVSNYTVQAGDSLAVFGEVDFFNGFAQFSPDSIAVLGTNASMIAPMAVTTVDESTEGQYIEFKNATLVDASAWSAGSNMNLLVTNGTDTITARFDKDIAAAAALTAPTGTFSVFGTGGQFDSSNPYTSGYQLQVCDFTTIASATAIANTSLLVYPNPVNGLLNIESANTIEAVTVYNAFGQTVLTLNVNQSAVQVNTAELTNGVYFVSIVSNNEVVTKQVQVIK